MRHKQPCASVHKMTTTRHHQNVPQTGIIHMIPHVPSRCGAKRTDAQRQERERTNKCSMFPASRVTIRAKPAHDVAFESVDVPSSGRSTTGRCLLTSLQVVCHFRSAHLILQQRNTICESFTTCWDVLLSPAHEIQVLVAVSPLTEDPSAGSLQTCSLPPVGGHLCCSPNTLTLRSVVGPGGSFRALATVASSLSCMTGSVEDDASFDHGVSNNLFNLFNVLFSPQRHHALHVRISLWQIRPERSILTFQLDASNKGQWCLIAKPCNLW